MIAWLKGTVVEADATEIVINTNGVGYQVVVGENMILQNSLNQGDEAELAIYTAVREDDIRLFGFQNFFSRKVFVLLLSVNGVGPKVALSIVDQLGAGEIVRALKRGGADIFTRVSGVGKKTAQRIMLDLQGKMELLKLEGEDEEWSNEISEPLNADEQEQLYQDAVSALSNLGFSVKSSEQAIAKYMVPEISLDELIRKCLLDLKKMA